MDGWMDGWKYKQELVAYASFHRLKLR